MQIVASLLYRFPFHKSSGNFFFLSNPGNRVIAWLDQIVNPGKKKLDNYFFEGHDKKSQRWRVKIKDLLFNRSCRISSPYRGL
jgi:hypothetical protein